MKTIAKKRCICFVTGTRAEFGLMQSTLRAIQSHPKLELQIMATGMHLDPQHGDPLSAFRDSGFQPDAIIPWPSSSKSPSATAQFTGRAIASLAKEFQELKPDIILMVGDRVEAFAAASAAHISQIPIAHVHGGDRALGQIDDSLRHAITKLAHLHLPATKESAQRIENLGEQKFRIHTVGSPALDDITGDLAPWSAILNDLPALPRGRYALILLHPSSANHHSEYERAHSLAAQVLRGNVEGLVFIYPNNDPGSAGIIRAWEHWQASPLLMGDLNLSVGMYKNLPRNLYLTFLQNAAVLIGNSSSGIIEAASFGTPVINIGDRQKGRERNKNVIDVPANPAAIRRALKKVWNNGRPIRFPRKNIYGSGRTSQKIAHLLATIPLDDRLRRKLISY